MINEGDGESEQLRKSAEELFESYNLDSLSEFADYSPINLETLINASVEELAGEDVRNSESAADVREEQFNSLRPLLFRFGIIVSGLCVVTSVFLALAMHFCSSNMSDAVAIAFISGLTVETLGIIAIIAHSLFPSHKQISGVE